VHRVRTVDHGARVLRRDFFGHEFFAQRGPANFKRRGYSGGGKVTRHGYHGFSRARKQAGQADNIGFKLTRVFDYHFGGGFYTEVAHIEPVA